MAERADPSPRRNLLPIAVLSMALAVGSKLYRGPLEAIVRGNAGDVLVVISFYSAIRALRPRDGRAATALLVLSLGVLVEICQALGVLDGSLHPTANYWLGHRFDSMDLLAYAIGAVLSLVIDRPAGRE